MELAQTRQLKKRPDQSAGHVEVACVLPLDCKLPESPREIGTGGSPRGTSISSGRRLLGSTSFWARGELVGVELVVISKDQAPAPARGFPYTPR